MSLLVEHERRVGRVDEVADEGRRGAAVESLAPRHVRRVARERDVGAGRLDCLPVEIGWPPLTSSKRAAAPVPTKRRDEHLVHAAPTSSSHATHGTVGLAGFIVPAATRGSSASSVGSLFSEHACSVVERGGARAEAVRPTCRASRGRRCRRPPSGSRRRRRRRASARLGGEHHLVGGQLQAGAGVACLVPDDPRHAVVRPGEGDVGLDAVARRIDVQARVARRDRRARTPVCWKQKPPIAGTWPVPSARRRRDAVAVRPCPGPIGLRRRRSGRLPAAGRWLLLPGDPRAGLGRVGGRAARDRRVLGVLVGVDVQRRDRHGAAPPLPRPWPAKIHLPWLASPCCRTGWRRCCWRRSRSPVVFSYQVAHGTVRPAPAKSIAGASPSWPWSKFSEPLNVGAALERPPTVPLPRVVQAPPANEREKIWSCAARLLLAEDRPRHRRLAGGQRAADDVGVGRVLAAHAERRVDPGRRVVVDLPARRQRLKRDAEPAAASAATVPATAIRDRRNLRPWIPMCLVMTVMSRLVEKKELTREKNGLQYEYWIPHSYSFLNRLKEKFFGIKDERACQPPHRNSGRSVQRRACRMERLVQKIRALKK